MPEETLLILNPASAAGATGRQRERLRSRIEAVLGPVGLETTRAPGDASRIAHRAAGSGVERILVAGGDGTTSEVANGLLQSGLAPLPRIGLLPLGSGLDLARALELPRSLDAALEVVRAGAVRRIDAGRVELRDERGAPFVRFFCNEVSAGLSGETVRIVERSAKRIGPRLGFVVGAVGAILGHRAVEVAVELDGSRIYEGAVSLVVAANGRYFGAGMEVAPNARPDDGRLEVVLVRGLAMPRLLVNLPSFYVGRHGRHPNVSFHAARSLVVIPKEGSAPVDLDGESVGRLPLRAEILPGALSVFAPAGSGAPR